MMMNQWSVFLPLYFNDGSPIPSKTLNGLEQLLIRRFGGITTLPEAEGVWVNGHQERFSDMIRIVQVVTPASPNTEAFMRWLAQQVKQELKQELVLFVSFPITTTTV